MRYKTIHPGDTIVTRKCACGCGEDLPIKYEDLYPSRIKRDGIKKFIYNHHMNLTGYRDNVSRARKNSRKDIPDISPSIGRRCRGNHYYAREVIEKHLGRKLLSSEYVHHKDKDTTNDDPSNLEIMSLSEHSKLHKPVQPDKHIELTCEYCGKKFTRLITATKNSKRNFCSKDCFYNNSLCRKVTPKEYNKIMRGGKGKAIKFYNIQREVTP